MKLKKWLESLLTDHKPTLEDAIEHLGNIFPLLHQFKDTIQDPIWHAEGDVHIHTNMVLDELYKIFENEFTPEPEQRQVLILAAILHDIAKPLVTKVVDGRVKASRHEVVGRDYLAFRLLELDLPSTSYKQIINLVGYHQRPKLLVIKEEPDYKYLALTHHFNYELMYWLEIADLRGRTCDDKDETIMYLDEYLAKTKAILARHQAESSLVRFDNYLQSKCSRYLLATGKINSKLEAPQKMFDMFKPENKFKFILMCGVPGSGKSTLINNVYKPRGYIVISMDDIRAELGDRRDQSKNKQVAIIAKERLKEALRKKQNVVWDATSIRQDHREELLSLAEAYGAFTRLIVVLNKESKIRSQNLNREFAVPDEVITRMISNFQYPTPLEAMSVLYFTTRLDERISDDNIKSLGE